MQVTTSKYDNFVNSINSKQTKEQYEYSLAQFLKHYQIDLDSFSDYHNKKYPITSLIISSAKECQNSIKSSYSVQ
jgi:hypothetical protein